MTATACADPQTRFGRPEQPCPRLRGRHPWLSHRACAPEDAPAVERDAEAHPEWLPRRHPEARGRGNEHVGYRHAAPAGAYVRIAVWRSRDHWLAFTVPITIGLHPAVLAKHGVSADLLRRWARLKSLYAWSNGRRCIVRPDTLASVLGVSERQVQRCNQAARELGLEVVVVPGRMLTLDERAQAYHAGSRQRGLASEVALTIPREQHGAVDHVTPPRGSYLSKKSQVDLLPLDRLTAGKKEAAPRPRPQRRRRPGPGPGFRLAQQAITTVRWLHNETPHRIAGALKRFADAGWTGVHIAQALAAQDARLGRGTLSADRIKTRPAVVLAAKLRELDPVTDHPGLSHGPLVALPPVSCGHPACDGRGWLRELVDVSGYSTALKCPRCHPNLRRNEAARDEEPAF